MTLTENGGEGVGDNSGKESDGAPGIRFVLPDAGSRTVEDHLAGLHDALTGAPLDPRLGLHRCNQCQVYYHSDSLQILKEANSTRCASCMSTDITAAGVGD